MNAPRLPASRGRQWAAIALLMLLLGPFAMSVTGCFTLVGMLASSPRDTDVRMVPAGEAIYLDRGRTLALHLRNGASVRGRYLGRTLLSRESYATRFQARSDAFAWTPLVLGETLTVDLADGRRMEAPFGGYAMRALVLRPGDTTGVRIPLHSVGAIRRASGARVSVDSLLAADLRGELPSAEALAIEEPGPNDGISGVRSTRREVPLEEVQMVTVTTTDNGRTAGLILAGVAADILLFLALREALKPKEPSCEYTGPSSYPTLGVRVTERPFDRHLGRFVGEDVAWGDSMHTTPDALEVAAAPLTSPAESTAASSGGLGHATGWR